MERKTIRRKELKLGVLGKAGNPEDIGLSAV
jgi:hypothetical protein